MFGSAYYERSRTPKDMEQVIFSAARSQAVEAVNGTYIQSETQVEQYQLVKDRITATISGRVQVEQTTNNFYIRVVSGNMSQISTVGLLAVYPWAAASGSSTHEAALSPATDPEIFQVDNASFSQLKAYPSGFVQDAQSFLEKAKSQNLTFQSQLRSLLSDVRTRLEQEEQGVIQAKTILERLESERRFYRQELEKRQDDKASIEQRLAPLDAEFKKANDQYRDFLCRRSVYQFQTDFKLDDYNLSSDQIYSGILRSCFDRFKNNIREEFLSWVTVVNFNQLTDYREARREIPARLEAARILYPYAQNNLDGRPTRGILVVFKARFDMSGIPDYTPGGGQGGTTAPGLSRGGSSAPRGMALIEGGTFQMGDTFGEGHSDEKPVHSVTVRSFYLAQTEVTFDEYDAFCTATKRKKPSDSGWGRGRRPVIHVTWFDAVEFCNWKSRQEGLTPCYQRSGDNVAWDRNANGYRLPTEAEWEYAAREGGRKVRFGNGKDIADPAEINFNGSAQYKKSFSVAGVYRRKTMPVGSFSPNRLGLYDMSGNVWEWCWDWYGSYGGGAQSDPAGPSSGRCRV
ncbi:MAG TPA: hypothetical protein ENN17_07825, partial [bacterium]|nr:hypothetical protein [bacterium]